MLTFFPGLTSLKATSAAVFAAAITSAARPVTGPDWMTCVWATTAIKPSIWHPKSLQKGRAVEQTFHICSEEEKKIKPIKIKKEKDLNFTS